MNRSIRSRLQWWYGLVYATAIIVFGLLVYWRADRDCHERAAVQVSATANHVDISLRTLPPHLALIAFPESVTIPSEPSLDPPPQIELERLPPELQFHLPPPRSGGPNDEQRPPPPPHHEPPLDHVGFIAWREDGSILTQSGEAEIVAWTTRPPPSVTGPEVSVLHGQAMIQALLQGPHNSTVLALRPMHHDFARLHRFGSQIVAIGIGILLVGLVGGWWVSGRMVRPLASIAQTAAQISATQLSARIETTQLEQELVPLAHVLNQTFASLEDSFSRLTRFTADASHELRTPLAVIQSQLELALTRPRSTDEYRQTLSTCLRSADRMKSLVEGLLLLARGDAGHFELQLVPLDLRTVAEEAALQWQARALEMGIELECQSPTEAVWVLADATFLARVPANLIDNALRHTPAGGKVQLLVEQDFQQARLIVTDTGSGIAPEHIPHLFERFYRADTARTREQGGCGLGLAICESLVKTLGGTIACSSVLDQGSTFTVGFPLAAAPTKTPAEPSYA